MAIETIKGPRKDFLDPVFRVHCHKCGAVLDYRLEDVKIPNTRDERDDSYIVCPHCYSSSTHDASHVRSVSKKGKKVRRAR